MGYPRRAPPRRTNSSPFLRKPVPRGEEDDVAASVPVRRTPRRLVSCDSNLHQLANVAAHHDQNNYNININNNETECVDMDTSHHKKNNSSGGSNKARHLERHLSLLDLVAIGVGGTIGSGLFVLAGLVAHEYAGPATALSWCLSGAAACLSGFCYAELSGRIPLAGSAYAYTYVAMGEVFAVVAGACLSLEYICAAAAVARSWGEKMVEWLTEMYPTTETWFASESTYNPLAFCVAAVVVGLLLCGVKESKRVANIFTTIKIALVAFMVVVALWYTAARGPYWVPFAPYGVAGVIRGATGTFFGYLGYDQVCCLAGEAKDAKRNLPRAILGVLVGCGALYIIATLALTGMLPYDQISPVSGFPDAFRTVGANLAAQITALGEIITLPIVILVTIMAQPRLQYAMAVDGLLPSMFEDIDGDGNLFTGTCIAGGIMTLVATFVPFEYLNDMISCAVLCALSLTDTSVIMLWHEPAHDPDSPLTCQLLMVFHAAALVGSLSLTHWSQAPLGIFVTAICVLAMVVSCWSVNQYCPRSTVFGGRRKHYHENELVREKGYFQTPFVPALPCLAIAINWYLIAQLELLGIAMLIGFLLLAVLYYFLYAQYHSIGNTQGWNTDEIELAADCKDNSDETDRLVR